MQIFQIEFSGNFALYRTIFFLWQRRGCSNRAQDGAVVGGVAAALDHFRAQHFAGRQLRDRHARGQRVVAGAVGQPAADRRDQRALVTRVAFRTGRLGRCAGRARADGAGDAAHIGGARLVDGLLVGGQLGLGQLVGGGFLVGREFLVELVLLLLLVFFVLRFFFGQLFFTRVFLGLQLGLLVVEFFLQLGLLGLFLGLLLGGLLLGLLAFQRDVGFLRRRRRFDRRGHRRRGFHDRLLFRLGRRRGRRRRWRGLLHGHIPHLGLDGDRLVALPVHAEPQEQHQQRVHGRGQRQRTPAVVFSRHLVRGAACGCGFHRLH